MALDKATLHAITQRWQVLDAEIQVHDAHLRTLTADSAPEFLKVHGMATGTAAEMRLLVGNNLTAFLRKLHFAKTYGACPISAFNGKFILARQCFGTTRKD